MTYQNEVESADVDIGDGSGSGSIVKKDNWLDPLPVLPHDTGEGLPYAPENWPSPGDMWSWRVGKRITASGFYQDRYLYLPSRFQKSRRGKDGFKSRLSVELYIQGRFPGADIKKFFDSFHWKIPSQQACLEKEGYGSLGISCLLSEELVEDSLADSLSGVPVCKAGNRACISLMEEVPHVPTISCDLCCSEPGFCRDCCCILCCKATDLDFGGYSFIRCEAASDDGLICGHLGHLSCALRSYMAGTVGGSISLDAEYYCRYCDTRTDLVAHVTRLLKICESIKSRDVLEKMLNLGVCILQGSKRKDTRILLNRFKLALEKVTCESAVEDIWKVEDYFLTDAADGMGCADEHPRFGALEEHYTSPIMPAERESELLALKKEMDKVLQELRLSQVCEYDIAKRRLLAQRDYLFNLYKKLDKEKSELARCSSSTGPDTLRRNILNKEDEIKYEIKKLKDMEMVAKGFGRTPKNILKEHFHLDV